MEKQSFLPIKFYHADGIQDYHKIRRYGKDWTVPVFDFIGFPPFQIVLPDSAATWTAVNTIWIVNAETGAETNIFAWLYTTSVKHIYDADSFWVSAFDFFPWDASGSVPITPGRYYYHIELDNDIELWSEVFDLCDMSLNALENAFSNDSGWTSFSSSYDSTQGVEMVTVQFCKNAAGVCSAELYFDVFFQEEVDVYVRAYDHSGAPACPSSNWADDVILSFYIGATEISEQLVVDAAGLFHKTFSVKHFGSPAHLEMNIPTANTTKGQMDIWVRRRYANDRVCIDYANTRNFCKIVYEDDWRIKFFLNAKQVIDNNNIEESVVEDDEVNKYRIIGTNQKYNTVQFVGGESLLNAMSLMRLHDDVKIITQTGEVMDVDELLLEQTVVDYEAVLIKLIYREESCSWTYCEFEVT